MTDVRHSTEATAQSAAICTALTEVAAERAHHAPDEASELRALKQEIAAGARPADIGEERADHVWSVTDNYWRRRWDGLSATPAPYAQQVSGITTMYNARRAAFEWRFPGVWEASVR